VCVSDLRQAEVEQLDAGLGQQDVLGLEVAVHDALAMGGVEGVCDLKCVFASRIEGQGSPQWFALNEFHDQIVGADVVERADVRVAEGADRPSLPNEAIAEFTQDHFDRHPATQARVLCLIDFSHAAATDRPNDPVRPKVGVGAKRHW